eukprot:766502-Prymnesium_polylepis.1
MGQGAMRAAREAPKLHNRSVEGPTGAVAAGGGTASIGPRRMLCCDAVAVPASHCHCGRAFVACCAEWPCACAWGVGLSSVCRGAVRVRVRPRLCVARRVLFPCLLW